MPPPPAQSNFQDPPHGTPDVLQSWPYIDQVFRAAPATLNGLIPAGTEPLSGTATLEFRPITVHLLVTRGMNTDFPDPTNPIPPAGLTGDVVIQILGMIGGGGWYLRRFALPLFRMVAFDISTWRDCRVQVLSSSVPGGTLIATVSNRRTNSTIVEVLTYAETYGAAGTYLVPPGAKSFASDVADPGFSWITDTQTGAPLAIVDAVLANVNHDVRGTHFLTTVANWRASWRIST